MAANTLPVGIVKRRLTPLELIALAAFAAYVLFELSFGVLPRYPQGSFFGWNTASDGVTVTYLTPGGPAEKAGIRLGDKVDWKSLPLLGRSNLVLNVPPYVDTKLTVKLERGQTMLTRTMKARLFDAPVQQAYRIEIIVLVVIQALGIVLVWLRPSRLTWAFLLGWGAPASAAFATPSVAAYAAIFGAAAIFTGAAAAATLVFISLFPHDYPRRALVWLVRAAIPLGVGVTLLALAVDTLIAVSPDPPPRWLLFPSQYVIGPALGIVTLLALAISAYTARGSERQRILPVLLAMALSLIATQLAAFYNVRFTGSFGTGVSLGMIDATSLLFAVAVLNGILRHRVIDISFTVSRTLVYTILTSILVGLFALVDFVSSKFVEQLRITVILEAAAALAFGIALNTLHSRVERFVDKFIFRRRHLAEQRLHRTAHALMHSESDRFIDEALVVEAMDAMELASAALFRRTGDGYARVLSEGWTGEYPDRLAPDDHLVVHLTAELQPVSLSEIRWPNVALPQGYAHPLLAIPIGVRHELVGFVLYAGHRGGEAIDPDERQALVAVSDAAGPAYEHIRTEQLSRECEQWHMEKAVLEHEQSLLREMVDALRGVGR
jgi:hypothetical protein